MAVHFSDPNELHGVQADVLWELLTLNPKLVRRPSLPVNQQLNTKNARIIVAINEVKAQADTATASVTKAMNYVNRVVGDAGNMEVQQKLTEIGGNVIDAAYGLKQQVGGILDQAKEYTDSKLANVNIEIIDGGTF